MALITCPNPECNRQNVSDIGTCPSCGRRPATYTEEELLKNKKNGICPECNSKTFVRRGKTNGSIAKKEELRKIDDKWCTDLYMYWDCGCHNCGWNERIYNDFAEEYNIPISEANEKANEYYKLVEQELLDSDPEYRQKKQKEKYDELVEKVKNTLDEIEYQNLFIQFRNLNGYENAEKLADECEGKYKALKQKRLEQDRIEKRRKEEYQKKLEKQRVERKRIEEEEKKQREDEEKKKKLWRIYITILISLVIFIVILSQLNYR